MSSTVTVKQGKPSKSGEHVDTSAAKVVKAAAAKAKDEGKSVERKQAIADAAKKMTGAEPKAPAAKPRGTGNGSGPSTRITAEWLSAKKRDVLVKDEVTTADGVTLTVVGRWTRRAKDGSLTPMVTGRIVSGAPDGKKKGDRHNAVAAGLTHVKK